MFKNKFFKKLITGVFLVIHTIEIFASPLMLDPNSRYNTKLDKSETGVPIVNISTPNNRGISVNEFLEYNIGKEGQVLNNADNVGRSHLAGMINSNPNLGPHQAAGLIVLQVNGSNRSQIEGYLEALSRKKVNVILSNENGIYFDNAGTINISKFTATTGKINLQDGDIIGIDVSRGNIAIGPKGFDGTKIDYVSLLAKTLEIAGSLVVNGNLEILAGSNHQDKQGNIVSKEQSSSQIAIDASQLGGMYANQIKIISTDKGAGVNSNAFIVSKNSKLEITVDGKVKVNKLQGNSIDIKAQNYEQTGLAHSDADIKIKADSIKLSGDGTQAEKKITLDGNVENSSVLYTKENLYTKDLKNTSDIQVLKDIEIDGRLVNSKNIKANEKILVASNVENTGDISTDGKFISSDVRTTKTLRAKDRIDIGNLENLGLVETDSNLNINGRLVNSKDIKANKEISVLSSVENSGIILTNNSLTIDGTLTNANNIQANKSISVSSLINNSGTILTNSTFTAKDTTNTNKIIAKNNIEIGNLTNTNIIATDGHLSVAGDLTNSGDINVAKEIEVEKNVENTGVILTNSTFSAKDTKTTNKLVAIGEINIKNLVNEGELATKNKLNVAGSLVNKKKIQAVGNINISSNVENAGTILTDANFSSGDISNTKTLIARGNISSGEINNSGIFSAGENLIVKGSVKNSQTIEATNINISGDSLINSSNIKAENISASVNKTKNDGEILALNEITLNTQKLDNTSKIAALQNIFTNNTVLTNSGEIVSNKKIELNNSDITNSNKILSNVVEMKNAANFNNTGTVSGTDVVVTTEKDIDLVGNLHGENSLTIQGNNILNNGNTTGKNSISIKANDFTNNRELSSQNLGLNASGDVVNNNILSATNLDIKAENLTNNDLIASENDLTIKVKNTLTNNHAKTIYSGNDLNIKARKILNDKAELIGENITLEAEHLKNNIGTIQARNNISIKADNLENVGEVKGFDTYTSYFETWDVDYLTTEEVKRWFKNDGKPYTEHGFTRIRDKVKDKQRNKFNEIANYMVKDIYPSLLFSKHQDYMRDYIGKNNTIKTGSAVIPRIALKERLISNAQTIHGKILANNNISITSNDNILNKDSVISAKNDVNIRTSNLENTVTTTKNPIRVKTGEEILNLSENYEDISLPKRLVPKATASIYYTRKFTDDYPYKYTYSNGEEVITFENMSYDEDTNDYISKEKIYIGRYGYVTGRPSVIEGRNVNIEAANVIKQGIDEANGRIRVEKPVIHQGITEKTVAQGHSSVNDKLSISNKEINSPTLNISKPITNEIEVFSNVKGVEDIIKSGKIETLPSLESSLFIKNIEPTAKYLMETRLKHISLSNYYGSDYFLEKVNYKDKKDKYDRVQRLGDSFYENQLVERSIIERLGTRFLNGKAISTKELIDNAEIEAKNLNLTIGTALSKEQISKLNKNIIWYEYQDVSGIKVLAPKIYLSKNTLTNLNSDGRSRIEGTELSSIKAKVLDNAALIGNKGNTYIEADTIINRNIGNQTGLITGDRTSLVAQNDIFNIGSKISASDELNLIAKNGNILNQSTIIESDYNYGDLNRTRHTELENIAEISSGNSLNILADNYTSIAGKTNAKDLNIAVKEDVNISSQELSGEQKFGKDGNNFNSYAFKSNVGSNVEAEKINIDAKNLNISASNLVAEKDININIKENINIVSNTNSVYTESQSKTKKGFGRGSSSTAIDYKETLKKSNILTGNNVNILSDKNILVTGSDIYALNNLNIGAKEDLIIASGLEGNSTVRQTTKTGLFKLSGKARTEDNLKYTNVESVIGAEKDVNLNSEKNVSIIASELVAGNDINIKAKENVNILAADDKFKSDKKETKYSVKSFASAKDLKFEAGLKASYSKNKEGNFSTKVKGSEISAQNDVNIESGKDTNIQASTILSKNMNIDTKGELNLLTKDEISINNMSGTEIEAKLSARLDLSGIKDTINSVVDVVKGLPELPKAINVAVDLVSGKDINESLEGNEEGIEEVSRILNGPKSGGVSAGIYASASIEKIKSKTEVKNSIGSNILSKENISLSSEENMKLKQANIQGKNISINSKKDVSIESGISTVNSKASSQSLNGEVNLISGEFNVGGGISKDKSNEKTHTNSKIYGENILIKSEDLTVKGGNIEADKVDIDAKNLHIESMQDEAKSKHQAINISVGKSSVGGGIEYGKYEKEWVKKQSSIIGREKAEINVAEKTNIVGAVIGGADTTLRTKELEFTNIEDKEKGFNVGINASANIGTTNVYNEANPDNPNKKMNISKSGSFNYDAVDKEQINRATIGAGRIIVDGKETSPNINRDESKAQEITKDVSVDKVGVEYSDNRKEWSLSSLQDIFGEQLKEAVIVPMDTLNKKLKLDEKNDFFVSDIAVYKLVVEKDLEGNIKENYIQVPNDTIFEKGSVAHTNGMNTNEVVAKDETIKLHLKKDINDNKLHYLENGEKKEFYVLQNRTHGNNSDLYESAIDKFGIKGDKKIYSEAAKELGEIIWRNRENIEEKSLFSQGNIQYYAALHYIEEKYGVGALEKIKTKKYTSAGSPLNAIDLISYLKNKKIIENPTVDNIIIKNDKLDLVTNIVGFNGTSILSRDPNMRKKIEEKEKYGIKYDIWAAHSHYSKGSKPNSYIDYSTWQKPLIYSDKFLKMLNIQNYFKNKEKIEINKGAERNEDIK